MSGTARLWWDGAQVTPRATCLLAPNPGVMTLDGTNTYLLAEPGARTMVVVDPGPADDAHLDRVVAAAEAEGRSVGLVLLTHHHLDHSAGAVALAERVGAPLRAADARLCRGGEPLGSEQLVVDGLELRVLPTPGHTADSVCVVVPADAALLTGDTVLGRGTTVVAHPDGELAAYLDTLDALSAAADTYRLRHLLPGHGPVLPAAGDAHPTPAEVVAAYRVHRHARLDQVRAAVAAGATTPTAVVETVYADVDRAAWPAAEQSVRAQLRYLGLEPEDADGAGVPAGSPDA